MSINFSILSAVEKKLTERAANNDRNNAVFHPSEWDGCHRKIAYAYYEAIKAIKLDHSSHKFDPQLERIFDCGHYMHSRWGGYIQLALTVRGKWACKNWMVHEEPKIFGQDNSIGIPKPTKCECGSERFEYVELGFYDETTNWGGHVDAVVEIPSTSTTPIIVDFKTMNPFQFDKLTAPVPKHKTQIQIYLYLSKLQLGKLIYEDKGSQKIKEFDVPRDDDYIAVKVEEAKRLKYLVSNKNSKGQRVLPERAYMSAGHKECLRCKYRGHCWNRGA